MSTFEPSLPGECVTAARKHLKIAWKFWLPRETRSAAYTEAAKLFRRDAAILEDWGFHPRQVAFARRHAARLERKARRLAGRGGGG